MEEEISLRDIYLILKKHVRWIVIPAIVFSVLAAIYAVFLVAPEFTSEATLTVQSTQIQAKSSDQLQTQSVQGFSNSQISTIATSRPVIEQVSKQLEPIKMFHLNGLKKTLMQNDWVKT